MRTALMVVLAVVAFAVGVFSMTVLCRAGEPAQPICAGEDSPNCWWQDPDTGAWYWNDADTGKSVYER